MVASIGAGIVAFAGLDRQQRSAPAGSERSGDTPTADEPSGATSTQPPTEQRPPTATRTTGQSQGGEQHTVELTDDLEFTPGALEIAVGDTVVWKTVGSVTHTVTAYEDQLPDGADYFASGGFESESAARDGFPDGSFGEGESYTVTFETTGDYEYFCIPHEQIGMTGTVTVK